MASGAACPRTLPNQAVVTMNKRIVRRGWPVLIAVLLLAAVAVLVPLLQGSPSPHPATSAASEVSGQNYQVCHEQSQYLTSPWTYDALASGSRSYTVSQYQALAGYGRTLPPLPSYIASERPGTRAAVIYAPGSSVSTNFKLGCRSNTPPTSIQVKPRRPNHT